MSFDQHIHEILNPPSFASRAHQHLVEATQNFLRLTRLLSGRASIHDPETQWGVRWAIWCGADVNERDFAGDTRLHESLDDLVITKILVGAGADLNAPGRYLGLSPVLQGLLLYNLPLWRSHCDQERRVLRYLIEQGSDLSCGETHALHLAIKDEELVDVILANGADINARDGRGRSALFRVETVKMAKVLLNHGADSNLRDNEGMAADQHHLADGKPRIAKAIVKHRSQALMKFAQHGRKGQDPSRTEARRAF